MKISTRGRYGLRAMIDLAKNEKDEAIPLRVISEREKVSEQYLEQLFANLRRAGFVKSVRGAHGGYRLNMAPTQITAGDILKVLEGPVAPVECVLGNSCDMIGHCAAHELWKKLSSSIEEVLESVTLEDLKEDAMKLELD